MKKVLLSIFLLLFHLQVFSQSDSIELDGIGKLRLGAYLSDIEDFLEKQDTVPFYSWYAPLTFEEGKLISELMDPLSASDSLYIHQYIKGQFLGLHERIYIPKDNNHRYFAGLRITSIKLFLDEEQRIISIGITIDPEDVSETTKNQLVNSLRNKFEYSECDTSFFYEVPPYPFYCSWFSDDGWYELLVSDMTEYGGGIGVSLNIVFILH